MSTSRYMLRVAQLDAFPWIEGKTRFTETLANPWTHYSLTDPTSEL